MRKSISLLGLIICTIGIYAQDATILPTNQAFWIQSSMNYGKNPGGCWDISGKPQEIVNESSINVWTIDEESNRNFYLKETSKPGWYRIAIADAYSKQLISVDGGSINLETSGTNIYSFNDLDRKWQKFRFKHLGEGKFKIYTVSNTAICLEGRKNENGTNVHLWEDHDGAWMEWHLVDPDTRKGYNPEKTSKTPDFFIDNTLAYNSSSNSETGSGDVTKAEVSNNKITITIDYFTINMSNGQKSATPTVKTISLNYANGFYYRKTTNQDGNEIVEQAQATPDGKNLSIGSDNFHISNPSYPKFFKDRMDKTFAYKESLAFVEGKEGTATISEVTDNSVTLSDTASGRNQNTGKIETKTFDMTIKYQDGVYSRGDINDYYETGKLVKNENNEDFFMLDGEQSSISLTVK